MKSDDKMKRLLDGISFTRLRPGKYSDAPLSLKKKPEKFCGAVFGSSEKKRYAATSPKLEICEKLADFHEEDHSYSPRTRTSAIAENTLGIGKTMEKPDDVSKLEEFLQVSFHDNSILVTNIDNAIVGRKSVRKVYFIRGEQIHQIWAVEASREIGKELAIYSIAYEAGVPTGRPLGFDIKSHATNYPFETAFLTGGFIEHAGDSYDLLIENLRFRPEKVFDSGVNIVKLISDMHCKLEFAKNKFNDYGINIPEANCEDEIKDRLVPVLGKNVSDLGGLIEACNRLGAQRKGARIISHGDAHTRQFVTQNDRSAQSLFASTNKFAVIDFGSLSYDFPESDYVCFWTHHQRKALTSCRVYDYHLEDVLKGCKNLSMRNAIIERTLWDVFELLDPQRTVNEDVEKKAKFHYAHFEMMGKSLSDYGLGTMHDKLKTEIRNAFTGTEYIALID